MGFGGSVPERVGEVVSGRLQLYTNVQSLFSVTTPVPARGMRLFIAPPLPSLDKSQKGRFLLLNMVDLVYVFLLWS